MTNIEPLSTICGAGPRRRIRPAANLLSSSPPKDGLAAASCALTFRDPCSVPRSSKRCRSYRFPLQPARCRLAARSPCTNSVRC